MSDKKDREGLSRRTFLQGSALSGALSPGLHSIALRKHAKKAVSPVLGPGHSPILLKVNGKNEQISVEPHETLLEVLREKLGLTGAKVGCDRGACGACTVLVNGIPRAGCLTPVMDMEGKTIETVEGLASKNRELSALQKAFIEEDAMQCGYCIPGFLMTAKAMIEKHSTITKSEMERELSGNLCRCGSQPHITRAIMRILGNEGS